MLAQNITTSCNWLVIRRTISSVQRYKFHELTEAWGMIIFAASFDLRLPPVAQKKKNII
jgi:hypothetical protein